jgi:transcriptional regulator NrdR family protein
MQDNVVEVCDVRLHRHSRILRRRRICWDCLQIGGRLLWYVCLIVAVVAQLKDDSVSVC